MTSLNQQTMDFNERIKVNFDDGNLANDAWLLLYKEFPEKLIQSKVILNVLVES